MLLTGGGSAPASGTTFFGPGVPAGTAAQVGAPIPLTGTWSHAQTQVVLESAPAAGTTATITVLLNGVSAGVACTITGAAKACTIPSLATIPGGNRLALQFTWTGTGGARRLMFTTELTRQ